MARIYAASLSMSQGDGVPQVHANLLVSQDGAKTSVALGWDLPTPINADGNAGEWLYAVLSRLVQDYDDHTVKSVAFERYPGAQGGTNE